MIEIHSLLAISTVSFLLTFILTPLVRDAFLGLGILDRPDGQRKIHRLAVPRVGGIPITLSYVAAYGVLLLSPWKAADFVIQQLPIIAKLLPAAALIFITGLLDDVFGLKPWQKLLGQFAGALVAVLGGLRIVVLAGYQVPPGVGIAITIAWLIGCTNAFNLIDGLDGLASGMGLFATLTTFVAALMHGNHMLALATLPLAGSLLGFLRYNFNPASVFLGDSGSLLVGFLLGSYSVIWSQKSATLLGMTAPLMAVAIPLLDTGLAIARRWLSGRPIFGADRAHIHHKLLDRGLTHRRVVLLMYLACSIYAVLSLLQSRSTNRFGGLVVLLFCLVTWLGIQHLGYAEFSVAGRTVFGGGLRRIIHGQIALHGLEQSLSKSASVEQCWQSLVQLGRDFGFVGLRVRLNGVAFSLPSIRQVPENCWQIHIPLPNGDYVHLFRDFDSSSQPAVIMPLVQVIRNTLSARLPRLRPPYYSPISSVETDLSSVLGLSAGISSFEPAAKDVNVGSLLAD
jgi:UDP-GlcNAc:undecaprenyl-phosphate GlcNAc-1-phosphate transferase